LASFERVEASQSHTGSSVKRHRYSPRAPDRAALCFAGYCGAV